MSYLIVSNVCHLLSSWAADDPKDQSQLVNKVIAWKQRLPPQQLCKDTACACVAYMCVGKLEHPEKDDQRAFMFLAERHETGCYTDLNVQAAGQIMYIN